MAKTANLNIRIDPDVKDSTDRIFSHFGISIADAVNIFLHKVMIVGGMPFDMTLPQYNDETLAAIQETRDIMAGRVQAKSYSSVQEMVDEILAEGDVC